MWVAFDGFVYDVTNFDHPDGIEKLISWAGTDWTKDLKIDSAILSDLGKLILHFMLILEKFKVGKYIDDAKTSGNEQESSAPLVLTIISIAIIGFLGYKYYKNDN